MTVRPRSLPARRVRPLLAAAVAATLAAAPLALVTLRADAATSPAFQRFTIDGAIAGASFTTVGHVFGTEQDIVTSGYGPLDDFGRPLQGGTLQLYRPGANLSTWTKVPIFGIDAGIIFPNATTIDDVDGDGDNDVIVPSGHFFGTDPTAPTPANTGEITWWENRGVAAAFTKHIVVTGQAGAYHGVQHVDLDGDGVKDLLSVSEEARMPADPIDDTVQTQFFKGLGGGAFAAPVVLAQNRGGSQPVVADLDHDGDLDIVSSQYFHLLNDQPGAASFLWLENTDTDHTLAAADFTPHTMATLYPTAGGRGVGMGFQVRPVPGFRGPGSVSWIGTNHVNRCTLPGTFAAIPEEVIEFLPNADLTAQWSLNTLSDNPTPPPACPSPYRDYAEPTFSDQITARYGTGQGAPGVLGYGDIDGDGDVDLAVSGDGDRRLWWIENLGGGETTLHRLTEPGEYFGQAGGAAVVDLNGNGTNELVFSSYDRNSLAIWSRDSLTASTVPPTTTVTSRLSVTPAKRTLKAGQRATWQVVLRGAAGGARRTVTVVFHPARGKDVRLGTVRLSTTSTSGVQRGAVTYRPRTKGTLIVRYAGTRVSATLKDTAVSARAAVVIRR